jgi:hypothetical protein
MPPLLLADSVAGLSSAPGRAFDQEFKLLRLTRAADDLHRHQAPAPAAQQHVPAPSVVVRPPRR